jgi:hypothetical protein
MIKIFKCRRSSIALIGMAMLWSLGYFKGVSVAESLAAITIGVAVANAGEKAVGYFKKGEPSV